MKEQLKLLQERHQQQQTIKKAIAAFLIYFIMCKKLVHTTLSTNSPFPHGANVSTSRLLYC